VAVAGQEELAAVVCRQHVHILVRHQAQARIRLRCLWFVAQVDMCVIGIRQCAGEWAYCRGLRRTEVEQRKENGSCHQTPETMQRHSPDMINNTTNVSESQLATLVTVSFKLVGTLYHLVRALDKSAIRLRFFFGGDPGKNGHV